MVFDFSKFNSEEHKERVRQRRLEEERKEALMKQTMAIVGCGIDKLGGWDFGSKEVKELSSVLVELFEREISEGITRFLTGGDLGASQVAFMVLHQMKEKYPEIKNILVVPFANFGKVWLREQTTLFAQLSLIADEVILVEDETGYKTNSGVAGAFSKEKMEQRSRYFADHISSLISVQPVKDKGFDPANSILYHSRGSGLRFTHVYPDHEFTYSTRFHF